jgi:hypothetical protein
MLWKFTDEAPPARVQGTWRTQVKPEGVVLSLWLNNEALPYTMWPTYQTTTALLDLWPHEAISPSAVLLSHEVVCELPDYDAMRLGLPRHIDADVLIVLDGRPESRHLQVHHEFLPYLGHRPLENMAFDYSIIYYKEQEYRFRPAQYKAFNACVIIQNKPNFDAVLNAYQLLYTMRHMSRNTAVRIEGYLPRLQMDDAKFFLLRHASQGMMLIPHISDDCEPVTVGDSAFKPWSHVWQSGEALPSAWVLPQHRYLQIPADWKALLGQLRSALRLINSHDTAQQYLSEHVPTEMRLAIR